jgi:predicted DNA binding CopG/RHH family protein
MKLKMAKTVPRFRSEEEEAEFWSTHDTSEIWKKGKPVRPTKMPAAQVKFIHERAEARKAAISIRLDPWQIETAKKIAARKSIGYQTQLRMWIAEGIQQEIEPRSRARKKQ